MPSKNTYKDINSRGGSDILIDVLQDRGMIKFLDDFLGPRNARAEYTYGEAILTLFASQCNGASRTEDIYLLRKFFKRHPKLKKGMSPDTLLKIYKELVVPNEYHKKENVSDKLAEKIKKGKAFDSHEVNANEITNELAVDVALKLGLISRGSTYDIDFDTTHITTKIKHGRKYYDGHGKKAYCPGVMMINNLPLYAENRNGDSNASFNLTSTIEKGISQIEAKGMHVGTIRIDAAGFNKEFIRFANRRGYKYVTRAQVATVKKEKQFITNWREVYINGRLTKVGDTVFYFGGEETRIIVKEVPKKNRNDDDDEFKYWGIATNDFEKSNEELLKLYAKRGDAENTFSDLKSFGWRILPTQRFDSNSVFLGLTIINYLMYRFSLKVLAPKFPFVKENIRPKTFKDKFMALSTYLENGIVTFSFNNMPWYSGLAGFT
jgi:hypothetical protein